MFLTGSLEFTQLCPTTSLVNPQTKRNFRNHIFTTESQLYNKQANLSKPTLQPECLQFYHAEASRIPSGDAET